MNSRIEKLLNETIKLSSFEVNSVLGAINYALLNRALSKTISLLPDAPPEASGIEGVADFEAGMRRPEIRKEAAPLIGLANRVQEVLEEYGTQPIQTFEGVLDFRLKNPVLRSTFEMDYNNRKRRGEEPAGGIRRFVDDQYTLALRARETLKAKGQTAVLELNRIDGVDEDVGEEVIDALWQKAEDKLRQRWYAQDDRSTSSMLDQSQKDEAAADRRLIEACMIELGMEPPEAPKRGVPMKDVQQAPYEHPSGTGRTAEMAMFFAKNEGVDKPK